jgi:hypothetical protein
METGQNTDFPNADSNSFLPATLPPPSLPLCPILPYHRWARTPESFQDSHPRFPIYHFSRKKVSFLLPVLFCF